MALCASVPEAPVFNRSKIRGVTLIGVLAVAGAARAGAHPPVRPVSTDLYSGRWYEIARTPNTMQKDCQGATSDFQGFTAGVFTVIETCHRGTPGGPAKTIKARAKIVAASDNTRFRMAFFGGLIHQEYWILDHADDDSWAVMATPGGNYVWLLSRRPVLAPAVQAAALARVAALGYSPAHLVFPAQADG
jgi:apolipoprotein D and lipocalin family protein